MKKIDKLTKKQEERMQEVLKEWLDIGRSTHAIDRKEAENAITAMYKEIGEPEPIFFWFPSPLQCMLGLAATKILAKDLPEIFKNEKTNLESNLGSNLRSNLGSNLRSNFRSNLESNLWSNLESNLGSNLRSNLGSNLESNLWSNLRSNLWSNLRSNLRSNLGSNLRSNLESNLGSNLDWNYYGANVWCAWKVFYDFCNEIGVPYSSQDRHHLDLWISEARHCHYWWPLKGVVFLSERPASITIDEMGRLHNENDAALYYHDGYGLYNWHGVSVPKWVIENPEQITPEKIFAESNAEIRRVMMERYGFRKFGDDLIKLGKAKLISKEDVWGEPVGYYHYKDDSGAVLGFVHVINGTTEKDGTKHEFILTVKADNDNATQAVLSTYPDLMVRLKNLPNKWDIIKRSVRS